MNPAVWGPYFWTTLHMTALGYPESPGMLERNVYKDFYMRFGDILPCGKCSVNYKKHLQELPPIDGFLGSRRELFGWTVALHNIVNREHGKREWTADEAWQHYTGVRREGGNGDAVKEHGRVKLLVLVNILVIAVVLLFLFKRDIFRQYK